MYVFVGVYVHMIIYLNNHVIYPVYVHMIAYHDLCIHVRVLKYAHICVSCCVFAREVCLLVHTQHLRLMTCQNTKQKKTALCNDRRLFERVWATSVCDTTVVCPPSPMHLCILNLQLECPWGHSTRMPLGAFY